jgi:8-amino-7-oxononanoate synthase
MGRVDDLMKKREGEGSLRILRSADIRGGGRISVNSIEYVDLSSNDYLDLSNHPRLVRASQEAAERFGTSSSASRLLSGSLKLHRELEERIASFKGKEASLLFNSGYQANTGIIPAISGKKGDAIFSDRLNHASIVDGALMSGSKVFRFRHNDTGHLESILKKERAGFKEALIVTETVFSMDGDRAPLKEITRLKREYGCTLMVDEAHATGIFGRRGSGMVEEEGLTGEVDLVMGTFGKALGGFGAYLAASRRTIDYLVNSCRSFIYSTALPPSVVAANLAALDLVMDEPYRRRALLRNASFLREGLKAAGLNVRGSSQIVPVIIGDNKRTQRLSERLREAGYWALPIRPPTVPEGESRLRFSLTYGHTKDILKRLLDETRNKRSVPVSG